MTNDVAIDDSSKPDRPRGDGKPVISVIVEGYNEAHSTSSILDTVQGLARQDYPLDRVELVLAGSSRQVEKWNRALPDLRSFKKVVTITVDGENYYVMKNSGVRMASGDIIALTDSDVVPAPTWLSAIARAAAGGKDVLAGLSLFRSDRRDSRSSEMLAAASISWGFVVGSHGEGHSPYPAGFVSHNIAFRKAVLQQFPLRTEFGRTISPHLLYRAAEAAGLTFALTPEQETAHQFFSLRWWLLELHFRFGYEVFMLRRLDEKYPNRWILRVPLLEPVLTAIWQVLLDVPRWFRFGALAGVPLRRRLSILPLLLVMSVAARASEMAGMYSTIFAYKATRRWAETS